MTPESGRIGKLAKSADSFRIALERFYQPDEPTWEAVAKFCGVSTESLRQWRQTEEWQVIERETREARIAGVVGRAAVYAWAKWVKESPQVFLRTAEHLGLIGAERHELISESQVDADIARLLARLAPIQEAAPIAAANGVAPNGASGPAKLR